MAKIPGVDTVLAGLMNVLQAQSDALAALPGAVQALSSAVTNLSEATAGVNETVQTVNRMAKRIDGLVAEFEEPIRALAPGMNRLAKVLDDPLISSVPSTLAQVQRDILPVLRTLADTHEKVAFIAGSTERIMAFVDDTGRTIAGLPGAALLGRRKPPAAKEPTKLIVPPLTDADES